MEQNLFNQLSRRLRMAPVAPSVSHLDKAWRTAYEALLKFAKREGHLQIPATLTVDGVPLSKWQANQLSRYHSRALSHEKTRLLERIPGWQWSDRDAAPLLSPKDDHRLEAVAANQPPARRIIAPSADQPRTRPIVAASANQPPLVRVVQPIADPAKAVEQVPDAPSEKVKKLRLSKGWMQGLSSLMTFVERVGHADVPSGHVESGFQLHDWVMVQRYAFLRGELQQNRIEHLERVSGWTWEIPASGEKKEPVSSLAVSSPMEETEDDLLRWMLFYPLLGEFVQKERHSRLEEASDLLEFAPLAKWVEQIRKRHRRGHLLPKRVKQLECLEGWSWESVVVVQEQRPTSLDVAVGEPKSSNEPNDAELVKPPKRKRAVEPKQAFKDGQPTPDKRQKASTRPRLMSERDKERHWHETFEHLWFFTRKEKHAQVPQGYEVEGVPLGAWVAEQRRLYRNGELNEPRRQKLEALSLWTWRPAPVPSE
jgi:hypothetical protein